MLEPTPSCLLWDIDGTLIDTTKLIAAALDHIYNRFYHRTLSETELRALIGTPLKHQIRVFGEPEAFGTDENTVIRAFIEYYEAHRDQERILLPVISVLKEGKRRGFPTGLVTSKNRAEIANTLPRLNIADDVDVIITADDTPNPKPAPDGLLAALECLHIPLAQRPLAVYIGDTVHDVQAAQAAGIRSIAVTWGAAPRSLLEAQKPTALCDTPAALACLLFGTSSVTDSESTI
jgi:pyrophosphatase PpaX